jgi:hypothetical protein
MKCVTSPIVERVKRVRLACEPDDVLAVSTSPTERASMSSAGSTAPFADPAAVTGDIINVAVVVEDDFATGLIPVALAQPIDRGSYTCFFSSPKLCSNRGLRRA